MTKSKDSIISTVTLATVFGVSVGLVCAWAYNIVKLAGMDGFSGMLVLRALGIFFPPLGVVMGML